MLAARGTKLRWFVRRDKTRRALADARVRATMGRGMHAASRATSFVVLCWKAEGSCIRSSCGP